MQHHITAAALGAAALFATTADAGSRFVTEPADFAQAPAYIYAGLEGEKCMEELRARNVPFTQVEATKGVDTPIRLTGPLHGVSFRPVQRQQPDEKNHNTIADCRLGLALDDLATVLEKEHVVLAEYYSMYRRRGVGFVKPGKRHPGGRAIDLVRLTLASGEAYTVQNDFHGMPGTYTCGDKASKPRKATPGAALWRDVVCQLDETRSFNLLLTPNHDWGHRDHLHMEVRSNIPWFLIH